MSLLYIRHSSITTSVMKCVILQQFGIVPIHIKLQSWIKNTIFRYILAQMHVVTRRKMYLWRKHIKILYLRVMNKLLHCIQFFRNWFDVGTRLIMSKAGYNTHMMMYHEHREWTLYIIHHVVVDVQVFGTDYVML